ncbi:IS630 family transposase [Tunicatimonas pelagia]|uniref:IS630 family transposase n=1 Tax=Tunicatimonas pelagia TaxID=931531 RepID=UPI0026659A76|nr:IS630 family transposase [Tunicatimonas pelagia]WKN46349.1 IS630 family transposase [Tunicatimonas pelagia]WKN46394.1 IS630 family transposase [Tunicatimonas pelagia]
MTAEFIARLEIILRLYVLPYDEQYPVICFDERPCFLIGDTVEGLDMQAGQVAKENYAYSKHGSCCVLAAIEPLTGQRFAHIRVKRRKQEFALFMQELVQHYPKAKRLRIVLDNLNTHGYHSFYEVFDAETAALLTQKVEFIFTPKNASWLNMIEIEFSVLSRQCLNRRIPCIKKLEKQVLTFFKERSGKGIKINWQFTQEQARQKLNRRYSEVNASNTKYK